MKKIQNLVFPILLIITLFTVRCTQDQFSEEVKTTHDSQTMTEYEFCGDSIVVDLIAGQHINVGTVTVGNDENNLYVTYEVDAPWTISETHVYVGPCEDIPFNNGGNPANGQFPYQMTHDNVSSYTYVIPLTDIADDCFCVVTHATVSNGGNPETAYGDGINFGGNRWGTYFEYCKQICTDPPPPPCGPEYCSSETAFAFGDLCFLDDVDNNFNRWGWSLGPISVPDSGSMDSGDIPIYAGAGQCDIDNGMLVGYLNYTLDSDGTLTVTYSMIDDFVMTETHLYVGNERYPTKPNGQNTVAPGRYGNQHELDNADADSYTIEDLTGDIYIIAHAVVQIPCEDE